MALSEPFAVTLLVTHAFDRVGARYLIGGSLASSFHGIPRTTDDADLVAELRRPQVDMFVAELANEFYVDADMIRDAIDRGRSFNVIHLATMFKVDVFVLTDDALAQEEMQRRSEHLLEPGSTVRAWFASAEDTVLQKLLWYRAGGGVSDRQWRDLVGVIRVQGSLLDVEYLRRWSSRLDLTELLKRALDDATT